MRSHAGSLAVRCLRVRPPAPAMHGLRHHQRAFRPSPLSAAARLTLGVLARLGAHSAIAWLILFGSSVVAGVAIRGTVWDHRVLPRVARLGSISFDGLALVPLALAIGALLTATTLATTPRRGATRALGAAIGAACTIAIACALFLYGASWAAFYGTGQFLDGTGMAIWLASPVQFLQHVAQLDPQLLFLVPATTVLATLLLVRGAVRHVERSGATARSVMPLAATGVLACAVGTLWANATVASAPAQVMDRATGSTRSLRATYAAAREFRAGPMAHLLARYQRLRARRDVIPAVAITVPVDTPKLLPMARYRASATHTRPHRWNVIVLVVESLRADRLLAYGGRRLVMPAVEELARTSRVFTDHLTTATHSNYASVVPLSGQYPLRATQQQIYPRHPTYPRVLIYDVLKAFGYHTAVFSSQNELWGGMYYYLDTGHIDHFLHSETYRGPTYVPEEDDGFFRFVQGAKRSGKIDDRFTVSEALRWLDSLSAGRGASRPFFIYMNLQNSHVPYQRPADFPPRFGSGHTSFRIGFNRFPPDSAAAVTDLYDNSLAYVDAQIGRLIGYLRDHQLWDSTLFVLTGDHGQAFYEHGVAAHGGLPFIELTRTPLIVRAPGLAPALDDRPAQHVDVPPTILALLGLPPHPAFQGIDLTGARPPADRPLFTIAQTALANGYAITRGRYTLILDARNGDVMLYDDLLDPAQRSDLSHSLHALRDTLDRELDMWRAVQLTYYARPQDQARWYPPIMHFPPLHVPPRSLAAEAEQRIHAN